MEKHLRYLAINGEEGKFVGFRHGTEKTENWDRNDTKVLFVTEGIIMRQALGHDDENNPNSILEDSKILMLDEAHASSTDIELIISRVVLRLKTVKNFRLVLMSATIDVERFQRRFRNMGIQDDQMCVFGTENRLQDLKNYCLNYFTPKIRDNFEYAFRTAVTLHHKY